MQRLTLNFLGVSVADHAPSRTFHERVLGFRTGQEPTPTWAFFGATLEERADLDCHGMVFELFAPGKKPWRRQVAVPWVQVRGAEKIAAGRNEATRVNCPGFGDGFELVAPESIRWRLREPEPRCAEVGAPVITGVELRVHDLAKMRDFYTNVIGMKPDSGDDRSVVLTQAATLPILVLVRSAVDIPLDQRNARSVAHDAPVWFSCETESIEETARNLHGLHVPVAQEVTEEEWGGTDMIINDPEGNPIQIVEYLANEE